MPFASASPNLEQLKHQAKDLLRAVRAADRGAWSRVVAQLPRLAGESSQGMDGSAVRLSHALLAIARENGFASWPKLKAFVLAASDTSTRTPPAESDSRESFTLPPPGQPDPATRAQALSALARHLADLAARGDAASLAARFSRLPRRDILAVRALLVACGEHSPLVGALLDGLTSADARIRYDCAHALDHFADDRCIGPLRQLLDDPVPRVRRMALHVLSCDDCKLTPLPALDDLTTLVIDHALRDSSINVRRHATVALGSCGRDARAEELLMTLACEATDPAIRREARRALRRRGMRSTA